MIDQHRGQKSYAKITAANPMYLWVRWLLAGGMFACDSEDHNENTGCSNPACFKFKEGSDVASDLP